MTIDITLSQDGGITAEFAGLCAEQGLGGHRFGLTYKLQPRGKLPENSVALLSGELHAGSPSSRWVTHLTASTSLPIIHRPKSYPRQIDFAGTLTDVQVAGLEAARVGEQLELEITIHATLANSPELEWPVQRAHERLMLSRGQWEPTLELLGAALVVPLLVPLVPDHPTGTRAQAARHLQTARKALLDGKPEEAVRVARMAIETRWPPHPGKQAAGGPKKERSLEERFDVMRQAVLDVAHGAAHPGIPAYTMADARAVVAAVAALLQRE